MKFILSCISTEFSRLKQHWAEADQQSAQRDSVRGSLQKLQTELGGLICLVDEQGAVQAQVAAPMPAGLLRTADGLLFAGRTAIYRMSAALDAFEESELASPNFNALHTIRPTRHGYLITSTGLDLILEFAPDGTLLWEWWAVDHGLDKTPFGHLRTIARDVDHRHIEYGTLMQTTHVNSAVELADGSIVATLFHQGSVIRIDRKSGRWRSLIDGLPCVHAARVVDDGLLSVADTLQGRALLLDVTGDCARIVESAHMKTDWLQDCLYLPRSARWLLVDGRHARVLFKSRSDHADDASVILHFDPEWRLYEALPLD